MFFEKLIDLLSRLTITFKATNSFNLENSTLRVIYISHECDIVRIFETLEFRPSFNNKWIVKFEKMVFILQSTTSHFQISPFKLQFICNVTPIQSISYKLYIIVRVNINLAQIFPAYPNCSIEVSLVKIKDLWRWCLIPSSWMLMKCFFSMD